MRALGFYMTSKAYAKFEGVFLRGYSMLMASHDLFDNWKDSDADDAPSRYNDSIALSDMGRSGVVIAVSAMDSYFTDRFCENLVPFLKRNKPSKKLIELIEEAGLDVASCIQMFSMNRPFRRVRNLLSDHLETIVTQRFEAIDGLYKCYSIPSLSKAVEKRTKRTTLLPSIKTVVNRRHRIVHGGDLNSHGKITPFNPLDMEKRLKKLNLFVKTADEILDNRFEKET